MRRLAWVICVTMGLAPAAMAQTNGPAPAEVPPASFEGREYVDSRGCAFLRSTFGENVTWIPRYGPDRQPVCDVDSPQALQDTADEPTPDAEPAVAAQSATPVPTPVPTTTPITLPVRPVAQPVAAPAPRRAAPQPRRTPTLPRADASGRHPSCPASAPYGQLVDTTLGRPLVRCVTSPSLFLSPIDNGAGHDPHAPIALPDGGRAHAAPASAVRTGAQVQVGSFSVPANATRLRTRLQSAGLPARIHATRNFHVVTVGPFTTGPSAHSALAQVRQMGFSDAFLRR